MVRKIMSAVGVGGVLLWASVAAAQVCGDADGSGSLSLVDGVQVLRAVAELPSTCTPERCDVDGNGTVSVTDGVAVLRSVAGLSVTFRCPGASDVEVRSLGSSALVPTAIGPTMEVDVQGAVSVTLVTTTVDANASFAFATLGLPTGPVQLTLIGQPPAMRTGIGAGQTTLTIPNSPSLPYVDGTYSFAVASSGPATVAYQAVINRRANLSAGRLHIRVFVVDPTTDAPPSSDDPAVAAITAAIGRKLAQAGIQLGSLTFGTVPTEIEQDTVSIDPDLDLNGNGVADQAEMLFAQTPRDTTARTIDLFLVREFIGSSTIGFSGGIPGPVMAPPTRSSGVVVAAFNGLSGSAFDAEQIAQIAVHESGHYLGLFHTTEVATSIEVNDPIPDTPTCPASVIQMNLASCPDVGNLMFPVLVSVSGQDALTAGQAFVLQRNPLVTD